LAAVGLSREFIHRAGNGMRGRGQAPEDDIEGGVDFILPGTGFTIVLDAGQQHIHQVSPCGPLAAGLEKLLEIRVHAAERRRPLVDWAKRIQIDVVKERGQVVNRHRHDVVEQNQARQLGSEFRHIFAGPSRREAIHQLTGVSSGAGFEVTHRSRSEKRVQHPSPDYHLRP
jgi:hypothetical protein